MEKNRGFLEPQYKPCRSRTFIFSRLCEAVFAVALIALGYYCTLFSAPKHHPSPFLHLSKHCDHLGPITATEFHARQTSLARTLHGLNASSWIGEPGASTQFYANISNSDWRLSERPLLLIITPSAKPNCLSIPAADVTYIEWAEEQSPYEPTMSIISNTAGAIFVDGYARNFIVDGLREAHPQTTRKSPAEIELLKCANEATLLSIRAVREKMHLGIQNAALPHGSGSDRALGKGDFALFDCTASLFGYHSDVTRHLDIWYNVRSAQIAASRAAHAGAVAADVDKAARGALNQSQYFSHRLGHGIGLEVHEQPYLNGGSKSILETGHTFSNEPGIYMEGKVGVRLEDCFFIQEDGSPAFLTAGVGGQARSPWMP
ncbi:Creatinase/aminopeptidase [Mycena rebaudengoi]|nr:Creatinase/aminopeptidase [Mycena rebaudengoi]